MSGREFENFPQMEEHPSDAPEIQHVVIPVPADQKPVSAEDAYNEVVIMPDQPEVGDGWGGNIGTGW